MVGLRIVNVQYQSVLINIKQKTDGNRKMEQNIWKTLEKMLIFNIIIKNCLQTQTLFIIIMNRQRQAPSQKRLSNIKASKQFVKSHQIHHDSEQQEIISEGYEDTMTKPLEHAKLKISIDEEETKKIGWEKGISCMNKQKIANKAIMKRQIPNIAKATAEVVSESVLQIPYNKKVEQIMSKKPLRQRLAGVLPPEVQLAIGFDHQQILKRMQHIDRTIEFLGTQRGMKIFFFSMIRTSIFEISCIHIDMGLIQQLLFLDENCYQVQWGFNDKTKRYDLKISLPQIDSMDTRRYEMRKKIVKFLIIEQAKFLASKNLTKLEPLKWHKQFQYQKVQIPQKSLPVHPTQLNSDLRNYPDEQIEKVENTVLKTIFKSKKNASVKSLSSASVADMIFSKVSAPEISQQILEMVRQKERINNARQEEMRLQTEKIDKQSMLKIYDEILLIFISKNVTNIFKVTLLEILQQRLRMKNELISSYLETLLKMKMNFLSTTLSSKKIEVVQIDRQKYKDGRALIETSF